MTKPLKLDDLARAMWEENLQIIPDGLCEPWDDETDALRNDWRSFARAILTTIHQAGFRIVPVEADEKMIVAGISERHGTAAPTWMSQSAKDIWQAMLNAAPKIEGTE